VQEYRDRLDSADNDEAQTSIIDVISAEKVVLDKEATVARLEAKAKACQELPPSIDAAKETVDQRQRQLAELIRKRDKLFEGIVE